MAINPALIQNLIRGLYGQGGGAAGFPLPGGVGVATPTGLPGGKGGGMAGMPVPPLQQPQVPAFSSPMNGIPPGKMPNIREAMMANMTGMLGQPNFGIPQFAPRAGGIGNPVPPSGPPVGYLPPPAGGAPIASGNRNPGGAYGFRGRSVYAAR